MKANYKLYTIKSIIISLLLIYSCEPKKDLYIAYGNFEVEEWLVSSEIPGKLISFNIHEGQAVKEGDIIAVVDSSTFTLQKEQINASIIAVKAKVQNANPQVKLLNTKISALQKEKNRLTQLLKDSLANQKLMDDLLSQEEILNAQINTVMDNISIANQGILAQTKPLKAQLSILNNQIAKCHIGAPTDGTISLSLVQKGEVIGAGMTICKIAAMDTMILRAFITGSQLSLIKLNQIVDIKIDHGEETNKTYDGQVTWISDQAEFTPKIIQTAEDRVNLVYAVKISVPNDGYLKSGMPAELHFNKNEGIKDQ